MTLTARLRAYAKLNLGLRVLFRRPDGYHELRTVFQTISLSDALDVTFTSARRTRVLVEGAPEIQDNLVERAARMILDAAGVHADVRFHLTKRIPAGAGLGGGSSDAAAVLLALPVLAGRSLPFDRLRAIAAELGSDVPFFLHGGTALGLGRGEELYPLPDRPATRALVVVPAIHSSTAEAYADLSPQLTPVSLQNKLDSFQQEVWDGISGPANDFEEPVFARHPGLGLLKERLRRSGAHSAAMTGSGSALFGIFADAERLRRAVKSLPGERTYAISFINRTQYRRSWQRALKPHTKGDQWPPQSLYAR
jgi:4-diphosphocytidyl-2-C-methyl-D-erythritol kinase